MSPGAFLAVTYSTPVHVFTYQIAFCSLDNTESDLPGREYMTYYYFRVRSSSLSQLIGTSMSICLSVRPNLFDCPSQSVYCSSSLFAARPICLTVRPICLLSVPSVWISYFLYNFKVYSDIFYTYSTFSILILFLY